MGPDTRTQRYQTGNKMMQLLPDQRRLSVRCNHSTCLASFNVFAVLYGNIAYTATQGRHHFMVEGVL